MPSLTSQRTLRAGVAAGQGRVQAQVQALAPVPHRALQSHQPLQAVVVLEVVLASALAAAAAVVVTATRQTKRGRVPRRRTQA